MANQIRDTEFGHLVRFLSRRKLFRYPDEDDASLWKQCLQRDTGSTAAPSGEQTNQLVGDLCPSSIVGDSQDTYLVQWYGPDDLEVRTC